MSDPILKAIEAERTRALARLTGGSRPKLSKAAVLDQMRGEMSEALAYRLGGPEPTDDAFRFVGMSFHEMVSTLLGFRGARWESSREMFARGITSSDVTARLQGAGNRMLRKAYESYAGGLLRVCGRVETRDFRDVKSIQVDGDAALVEVKEGAPFAEGFLKAGAESYAISTFGRILGWSPGLFSNDDLGAFADMSARLGRMSAEFVAGKLATLLESSPSLSDGVAVFHATHANLGTAGALSETTLGELLKLVRSQTGLGGEPIAAVPRALVVPAALEFPARKLVTLLGNPAPLEVVVEPRLKSATAFYVFADPSTLDTITYTYGAGGEGPTIEVGPRRGFQGLAAKVVLDFGAGFVDFRGVAKNVGQ
jgi:hypothetical protein